MLNYFKKFVGLFRRPKPVPEPEVDPIVEAESRILSRVGDELERVKSVTRAEVEAFKESQANLESKFLGLLKELNETFEAKMAAKADAQIEVATTIESEPKPKKKIRKPQKFDMSF